MSVSLSYNWPANDEQAVALIQNVAADASFILNGTYSINSVNGDYVSFIAQSMARNITVTTNADYRGVELIITGTQNGISVLEVINCGNNTTIYGEKVFDIINSITTNADVNNISIGSGSVGFFKIIPLNYLKDYINYTLQIQQSSEDIEFNIWASIANNLNKKILFNDLINTCAVVPMSDASTSLVSTNNENFTVWRYFLVQIGSNDQEQSKDDIITFNFLQV